jgi:hypothetical protein
METEFEEHKVEQVSIDIINSQEKAVADSQVAIAKKYPRNLAKAKASIETIVQMDKDTAQSCGYALPRDGKNVTGPTIHLANIVLQQYGNARVDAKVVSVGESTLTVQATAWDLETNVAVRHEVMRKITYKSGKKYNEDLIVLTANAAMSIAKRNVIFGIVPKPVWMAGYEAAQRLIVGDISDDDKLNVRRREVLDKLIAAYEVKEQDILNVLGFNSIQQIKGDHLKILIGYGVAIRDGDSTVDQIFFPFKNLESQETAQTTSANQIKNLKNKANGGNTGTGS